MIKRSNTAAKALLFLFLSLLSPLSTLSCNAQGPMPSEIAEDMLSLDAFKTPKNETGTKTENDVIRTAFNVRPSTVQIQVGREYGAGNIVSIKSDKILILTAEHVVKNWDDTGSNYVIFFNGKVALDARLEVKDPDFDAAIISVATSSIDPYDLISLREISIDYQAFNTFEKEKKQTAIALDSEHIVNAKELQSYDYYGTNSGIAGKYIYGSVINPDIMVTDYGYKMIYIKMNAHSGMSGGGVFDIFGNYVGILVGGSDKGETVAVRLTDIQHMLSNLETASSNEFSGE
ncbi:trypsin-like peptidase domain-containing protein [Butyrivibrio sp. VCD2006]|uniref:trypsin-like peptidase domain-containing protein n=1 Tax=Butyrivibrio sp. VCD2006 TaxID=1280664 RepID=UPI0009DBBC6D|nr:trypsin-like peptidase domain-containing protein [Butyrivibrio sp. VCD2006]